LEITRFPFCRYDASNDKYQPPPGVEIRVNMTLDSMCNETESASVRSLQPFAPNGPRLRSVPGESPSALRGGAKA
jgi:hypothetical protein